MSMNRCKVSWRSLLLPTAGMIALSVAALRFEFMMMRAISAKARCAWDARAPGSSSRRQAVWASHGNALQKIRDRRKAGVPHRLVVGCSPSYEVHLWWVVGLAVPLGVIELDATYCLLRKEPPQAISPQASVRAVTPILVEP